MPNQTPRLGEPFAIRLVAAGDAPALAAFYNSLPPATIHTFRPLGEHTTLAICQEIVEANWLMPRARYDLLGWQAAQIGGWAFLANLHTPQPYLGIVVAEALRSQGAGKLLLTHLLDWAHTQGIPKIYLMVVQDNQRAINLYTRFGFVTYDEEFDEVDQLPYYHMLVELSAATSPSLPDYISPPSSQ
jgi:GNAT superfamily N-acetyltransferase